MRCDSISCCASHPPLRPSPAPPSKTKGRSDPTDPDRSQPAALYENAAGQDARPLPFEPRPGLRGSGAGALPVAEPTVPHPGSPLAPEPSAHLKRKVPIVKVTSDKVRACLTLRAASRRELVVEIGCCNSWSATGLLLGIPSPLPHTRPHPYLCRM